MALPRTRFERLIPPEPAKHTEVFSLYLVEGRAYLYQGKRCEFLGLEGTGKALIHPSGEQLRSVDPYELTPCPTS